VDLQLLASTPVAIAGLLVFATYTIQAKTGYGEPLTTGKAYTTLSLISTLSQPSSMLLQTISAIFSVSANIKRLEEHLQKAEKRNSCYPTTDTSENGDGAAYIITIDSAQLDVSIGSSRMLIDLKIMRHTTTMISGPVGSGKSTLLLMLLGERAPSSGSMTNRASSVGFCSANPWLRNATIQENIVNDQVFNDGWYHTIVSVCDLNTDLALLPRGNDTPIGSRGSTLSGGQKHRIALARALYSRCSLLLLDETFDALDYQTRHNVLDRLLKHIKQHKLTLVFISHDSKLMIKTLTHYPKLTAYSKLGTIY
jgi:ATP-binding cassette, subfamily C (CFTR/MRP), member 1